MALLPTNQKDQTKLLVAIIALALAGLYWNFVYGPKSEELDATEERVTALESANDRAKRELAKGNVEQLRAQAQQYRENLELMRQLVPTGNEVPALLEQVSNAARRAGLDIASVEPQPVIAGEQFDTYRYRFSVTGSYHQLGEFLANVGSLPRIMSPVNLRLAPVTTEQAKREQQKGRSLVGSVFEIQTYVAKVSAPGEVERRSNSENRS